jgi:hypothetical protein
MASWSRMARLAESRAQVVYPGLNSSMMIKVRRSDSDPTAGLEVTGPASSRLISDCPVSLIRRDGQGQVAEDGSMLCFPSRCEDRSWIGFTRGVRFGVACASVGYDKS